MNQKKHDGQLRVKIKLKYNLHVLILTGIVLLQINYGQVCHPHDGMILMWYLMDKKLVCIWMVKINQLEHLIIFRRES
jgi:hypothetical protein